MDEFDVPLEIGPGPKTIGVLVVDASGFSRHDDAQQDVLVREIPKALELACRHSGLERMWRDRMFPDSTGDGFIIGFDERYLHTVVDNLPDTLQRVLRGLVTRLTADGMSLRMRLSVNLGPVSLIEDSQIDSPVGKTMIDTHRLVDSAPLRLLLNRSHPSVTLVATVVSEAVMDAVVRAGHTVYQEEEYVATTTRIEAKDFQGTAYLRVPRPSGDVLRLGLLGVQNDAKEGDERPPYDALPAIPAASQAATVTNSGAISGQVGVLGAFSGRDLNQGVGRVQHVKAERDAYTADRMSVRNFNDGDRDRRGGE